MDFFQIQETKSKKEGYTVSPVFLVKPSKDLMVRGGDFYAVWDEEAQLWSRDEFRVVSLVDAELAAYAENLRAKTDLEVHVTYMRHSNSMAWKAYRQYITSIPDHYVSLDNRITFQNTETTRESYASKRLEYPLKEGSIDAYKEVMSTLYDPDEREKLEWAVGAIVKGDSTWIQKFIVLYGSAGSGKSTFMNLVEDMFKPYKVNFEAKSIGSANSTFSMEAFRSNPLVAVQQDGDLSRIEDNTKLNSIISHESMQMNEKFKSAYDHSVKAFLFMGTNKPVKITDAKSGLLRRLIDVTPSGRKIPERRYEKLVILMRYEMGAIAYHCLQVYESLGPDYYSEYKPISMLIQTNSFYNFMEENYDTFVDADTVGGISLSRAWAIYKEYCNDAAMEYKLPKYKFRDEFGNYFCQFNDKKRINGKSCWFVFSGFKKEQFEEGYGSVKKKNTEEEEESEMRDLDQIELNETQSGLDILLADCPAQYATEQETPIRKWENVTTTLKDLDTTKLHYVRPPENHIVIDFDLKDENGNKSAERNLEAAARWPLTYAEFSKGGNGVHLHYIYDGDVTQLSALYSPGIEVKVFSGKSSLRRKLSYCNDLPVAHLSSGLPLKEVRNVVNFTRITSEIGLRELINKNLRKEIMPATKPSIDFIYKDLEAAYNSGLIYDVRDMRPRILAFANNSSHQSDYCVSLVAKMKFCSEKEGTPGSYNEDDPIAFYDIEVFPNLLLVCWKYEGEGHEVVRMFNPTPEQIGDLFRLKLVGYNSSRYDAHILYARYLGWNNEQLYHLSQKIVAGDRDESRSALFREAYSVDYVDVYDFAATKQSLKKWEIELGIHHLENSYPWDEPLDESHWSEVADYCCNDVIATEAVFNHLQGDFTARKILADLAGMPVNTSTNRLTEKIIFEGDRNPKLIYTHLDTGEQE